MRRIFRNLFLGVLVMSGTATSMYAQRVTDNLNRGLVAVVPRNGSGIFLSWRIQANEYYDVTYNVYRNGSKIASNLNVSNYMDASGSTSNTYTVRAVVNGVEQAASEAAKVFGTGRSTYASGAPAYLSIPMRDVYDRNNRLIYSADGTVCEWNYSLNDVSLADLDGDGEVEVIVKRINETDAATSYPNGTSKQLYEASNSTAYTIIEAYKMNGNRLWWIDCGPNMVSMSDVETNCVAYDWDEDGKAEVIMRGADNMIIHKADGSAYYVGNMGVNTRNDLVSHTNTQYAWTRTGAEYLLYLNGETGAPYSVSEYPLKRFESNETGMTEQQVWSPTNSNGGYGHRSSKYFFGAPVLDGRNAYIFLARGIYTQTKMVALRVNKQTHALTQHWYWKNNTVGSPWFGQGNHNMSIADVDGDGCDEIIYGSMVIDNNGQGLSTTGLGHGDALHVGDLDPFRKGLEVFACNEENPANNLRDATTSEILYRSTSSGDDGRAIMLNVSNDYPGCLGRSVSSGVISAAAKTTVSNFASADNFMPWSQLDGRIYWDGDLLEEFRCSTSGSENQPIVVAKIGYNRIMQTEGAMTINSTKKNHCAQGDIIGDWREEIVARSSDNKELRIYSTDVPTEWRVPSLWYDHEYRQAMVWQACGYNQPPHTSFFLGELEGVTRAPLPLTMAGRTELAKNGIITSAHNGQHLLLCNDGTNASYGINANGASPSLVVVNAASSVNGTGNNNGITYATSQIMLGAKINNVDYKGDLTGAMRLVKQGDGLLKLTAKTFNYTGDTEIWGGSFHFRGTFKNSNVWMNRHTEFFCGATIKNSLTMEYGSKLYPSKDKVTAADVEYYTAKIETLNMHEGSRIVFQMSPTASDAVEIGTINIRKQNWEYGPQYLAPVFEIQSTTQLPEGRYQLGTLNTVGTGSLSDIIVECNNASAATQIVQDGNALYLVVGGNTTVEEPQDEDTTGNDEEEEIVDNEPLTEEILAEYTVNYNNLPDWIETYRLDFEQTSSNNYGFTTNGASISQQTKSNGSHMLHVNQGGGSGNRTANISFANVAAFANAANYKFEFDWGFSVSNQNASETRVLADNGATLFYISTPKYGASTLYNANGGTIATLTNDGYTKACPTKLSHFTITSNAGGTYLTVTYNGSTVANNVQLASGLQHITAINSTLGRAVSHLAIDDIILSVSRISAGSEAYRLDFEQSSSNNYGFITNGATITQEQKSNGTHLLHANQGGGSGNRTANISFAGNSAFASASNYKLEFDWGFSVSNQNTSETRVLADNGTTLFYISTPKYGASTLYNASGSTIATLTNDGYTKACPTKLSHFTITSNGKGTYLTVSYNGSTVVNNVQLTNGLQHVTAINSTLGRAVSHLAIDDIILTVYNLTGVVTDTETPNLEPGAYSALYINRGNLHQGYNTFSIPVNTTVAAVAGNNARAYALSDITVSGGTATFKYVETNEIVANKPYLIYVPQETAVAGVLTNVTVEAVRSIAITKHGYKFASNYVPGNYTEGIFTQNGDVQGTCGSSIWMNGLGAYLIQGSNALAKAVEMSFDETTGINAATNENTIETVYSINGVPQGNLRKGVNIVKMSDGTVRKVYIK